MPAKEYLIIKGQYNCLLILLFLHEYAFMVVTLYYVQIISVIVNTGYNLYANLSLLPMLVLSYFLTL